MTMRILILGAGGQGQVLAIEMMHVLHVHTLPDYHRDPFDRLLVAQSQLEKMPILTGDAQVGRYAVAVIW